MQYLARTADTASPSETAVIVPVPAAEALVDEHRLRLDASAGWGVPAHVTVLYPFVEPTAVDEHVIARLAAAVRPVRAFDCRFARTRWFGDEVLWLDPDPAEKFSQLTAAVYSAFPEHPPYGGAYDVVVPHLTVAERQLADLPAMRTADRDVQLGLPLLARIDRVLLIAGTQASGSWRTLHELALSADSTTA